ncbi:RNA-dependent RNA polymerase [Conidiobolus heterosporus totivirus 1]|uniref:RNA-directed RNA polymerase n=1 Tax=Conidiobolus heterosporus totivirus 1 TaxID=2829526 RepID=A0AAE7RD20_9VIRU|nr:RNA-dependent RNA polymerase [Conidiobolus heterosporus totivirus 1]
MEDKESFMNGRLELRRRGYDVKKREDIGVVTMERTNKRGSERKYRFREGYIPTGLKHSEEGNLIAAAFSDSEFILIDKVKSLFTTGEFIYDSFDVSVSAYGVGVEGYTYVYAKLDQEMVPVNGYVTALMARHFMGNFDIWYNDPANLENVFLGNGKREQKKWNKLNLESLPKPKISGEHHIHFTAKEVWDVLNEEQKKRAEQVRRLGGELTTSFVAGVMLWLATLDEDIFKMLVQTDILDAEDPVEYAKRAKKLSIQAKSLQNIVDADLRVLFEADVLVNRAYGAVDWETEKKNRIHCNLAKVTYQETKDIATRLFTENYHLGERPRTLSWDKFWSSRWQWSASGSIHSQYSEDNKYIAKEREIKNKFISLIAMPEHEIDHFLDRKPEIMAWSSVKYEWGKMRAIYGTDITSYVLTHFAFYNCEDVLPAHFPVGKKARPTYVRSRIASVLQNSIPFCIDFEDFNSQHSNDAMRAVLEAYYEVYSDSFTPEQAKAAQWAIKSIKNTNIIDNMATKTEYSPNGTLMSGWRLTTFVNSVLNYVYTQKLIGKQETTFRSVHNGDDVLVGIKNLKVVRDVTANAQKHNIRLQTVKSNLGSIAEFLRVDHARGEYGQYLTRNIATLMHSRIESKKAVTLNDLVEAMEERLNEYVTRGGLYDIAIRLRDKYYEHVAPIYKATKQDAFIIKTTHRVAGGISSRRNASIDNIVEIEEERQELMIDMKLPGVGAYADLIIAALDLQASRKKVRQRVFKATLNAVQLVRKSVTITPNDEQKRYLVLRALYKSFADVADNPLFGKAKMTGFVFDVLNTNPNMRLLAMKLHGSRDPMKLLTVIT